MAKIIILSEFDPIHEDDITTGREKILLLLRLKE